MIAITGQNGDIGTIFTKLAIQNGIDTFPLNDSVSDKCKLVHMAAKSPPTDINTMIESNIAYTQETIAKAQSLGIKKAFFFSAMSIYGAQTEENISEKSCLLLPDYYGSTKYIGEKLFEASSLDTISLRLPAVLGYKNKTNIISRIYSKLKNDETITLFNANKIFNNFIDVDSIFNFITRVDIVKCFDVVNLAAKQENSLYEIVSFMKSLLSSNSNIVCSNESKPFFNISTNKAHIDYGFDAPSVYCILEKWVKEVEKYDNTQLSKTIC